MEALALLINDLRKGRAVIVLEPNTDKDGNLVEPPTVVFRVQRADGQ